jgi:hypothetical protein
MGGPGNSAGPPALRQLRADHHVRPPGHRPLGSGRPAADARPADGRPRRRARRRRGRARGADRSGGRRPGRDVRGDPPEARLGARAREHVGGRRAGARRRAARADARADREPLGRGPVRPAVRSRARARPAVRRVVGALRALGGQPVDRAQADRHERAGRPRRGAAGDPCPDARALPHREPADPVGQRARSPRRSRRPASSRRAASTSTTGPARTIPRRI